MSDDHFLKNVESQLEEKGEEPVILSLIRSLHKLTLTDCTNIGPEVKCFLSKYTQLFFPYLPILQNTQLLDISVHFQK